MLIVVVKAY